MVLQLVITGETGVYKNMDQWIELRRKIHNEHVPLRQLERDSGRQCQILQEELHGSRTAGEGLR